MAMLVLSVLPAVLANSVGSGITPDITTEDFQPRIWMCDNRVVMDDDTEPGREDFDAIFAQKIEICDENDDDLDTTAEYCDFICSGNPDAGCEAACLAADAAMDAQDEPAEHCPILKGNELLERVNNYAFEGESIEWLVLVMDKNKIESITDVVGTVGNVQGEGNDVEVECVRLNGFASPGDDLDESCNARIDEEELDTFDDQVMAYYECTLTVETPDSMFGEYWITVEAMDADGLSATMDENEYWFLNPTIALSIDGDPEFEDVRPGTDSYSDTILVGNDADEGSGVLLDMFISGTNFYDSSSSGARCPITNELSLNTFRYFATHGAYSTATDFENDAVDGDRDRDAEGYVNIDYGIGFNDPNPFYNNMEIIQAGGIDAGDENALVYYPANVVSPGSEMAVTFKLSLPEPCNGDFDTGDIFFWGEAI
ncbi:MAG: hypothetical protein RL557_870 [archaeon]|jgi:hypothetical protein